MKKSFLILSAIALVSLAACGGGKKKTDPTTEPGKTTPAPVTPTSGGNIPTEEGKVTFYFTLGEDSPELPEYADYFVTGVFNGWKTAVGEALTMKQLGDSNVYYAIYDGEMDPACVEDPGYQLTMGYNAESGSPTTGVSWTNKSIECAAYEGLEHPLYTVEAENLMNLGTHHWDSVPSPVKIVTGATVALEFEEAVPEYVELHIPGGFNGWGLAKMTADAERKVFTYDLPDVVYGTYECKVVAEYAGVEALTWGHTVVDDGAGGNYQLMVLATDSGKTISINEADFDGEPLVHDFSDFVDPSAADYVDLTIKVNLAVALENNLDWSVIGDFTSWAPVAMTINEDKDLLTAEFEDMMVGAALSFGICVDSDWHIAVKGADGENLSAQVPAEGELNIYVDADNVALMDGEIDVTQWVNVVGTFAV